MKIAPRPIIAVLILFTLYPAAAAQESSLRGTFVLDRAHSDDLNRAVEEAVGRMSVVLRQPTRARLRRTNQPYGRVVINYTERLVSVTFDQRRAIESPADGTPVKWTREDGEKFDLSTEWEGGRLVQTFKGEGKEERTNTFSVSADGRTLTLGVVVRSPKLPRPLTYKLVFNRAS